VISYDKLYFQYKKLYLSYLDKIIPILNDYHKKSYTNQYWEPIIGLYLRKLIFNYIFLQRIIKKKNFFKKANIKNFIYYQDFSEFENDSDFKNITKRYFLKAEKIKNVKSYRFSKKPLIFGILNFLKIMIPFILIKFNITRIFFQESYFKKDLKMFFSFKTYLFFSSLPFLRFKKLNFDKKKIFKNRLCLVKKYENYNNKDYLLQNLIFSMPVSYIENFDVISNEVKKIPLSDGLYVDGNEVKFDFVKFYIARLKLDKKKIFIGQHSLRTGLENFDIYSDFSKSTSNYFLTWGWRDKLKSIVEFSSMRIFSSLKKYEKVEFVEDNKKLDICFILCAFSTMGYCFSDNFIENKKAEEGRISLLKKMKNKKKCKITLKPRDGSFITKNTKKFYSYFKILKDKTRMYEIFGNHDIIIFERISLGIAECINLNQPVIFYYPKNLYKEKNPKFNELLFLLKKANMVFDDSKKILKLLNSKKNISLWWNNKDNTKVRENFLKKFAKSFDYDDVKKIKKLI
tara:strand:- start:2236 stop:3777 length:1542 start_codon:yes stop_codon:yes gene_type:complete